MKKKVKYICWGVIIVIVGCLYSFVDRTSDIYDGKVDTSQYIQIDMSNTEKIQQTFLIKSEEFDGFCVKAKVEGESEAVSLRYQLLDTESNSIINEGEIDGNKISNSKFYKVKVDKIKDCKGKKYQLSFQQNTNNDESKILLFYTKNGDESITLETEEDEVDGAMVLRLIKSGFDVETLIVFLVFALYIMVFMKILYKLFK